MEVGGTIPRGVMIAAGGVDRASILVNLLDAINSEQFMAVTGYMIL